MSSLFKYCPLESYTIKNIENSTVLFKDPNFFNDPFEFNHYLADPNEYDSPDIGPDMCRSQEERNKQNASMYRVFCLCEKGPKSPESLLMWAYYANEHKGVAVEFDYDILSTSFKGHPYKVDYEIDTPFHQDANGNQQAFKIARTKSKHWDHEDEHRFLVLTTTAQSIGLPETPEVPKSIGTLMLYDPKAVRGIYFGLRSSSPEKDELVALAKKRGIPIHQMKKCAYQYRLDADSI